MQSDMLFVSKPGKALSRAPEVHAVHFSVRMSPRDEYVPPWAVQPSKQGEKFLQGTTEDGTVTVVPVDAKSAYLLGRNGQVCDVTVDHKSASRVHACLAHHKEGTLYLVDLGSVHGTGLVAAFTSKLQLPVVAV